MPTNTFNIGRDCRLVVIGPFGRVDFSIVTDFDAKPNYKDLNVDGLDGINYNASLPQHWDITFGMSRGSSAADDLIAAMDNAYFTTGALLIGQVYQYITEVNGSTSTWLYDQVTFKLSDAGTWKGDSTVMQKVTGRCSRRRRV